MPMTAGGPEIPQSSLAVQQRLQISELHFGKSPTPSTSSCFEENIHNEVTICSDFPSEAILWIEEVEMVDSVDDLKSSSSNEGKDFPIFEMLDAKIASVLNRILRKLCNGAKKWIWLIQWMF